MTQAQLCVAPDDEVAAMMTTDDDCSRKIHWASDARLGQGKPSIINGDNECILVS